MADKPGYNVVFEYTGKAGIYEGVRTIVSFDSKEQFEKNYVKTDEELVIAQGVTEEQATAYCAQTPEHNIAVLLAGAGGKVDRGLEAEIAIISATTLRIRSQSNKN